MTTTARTCQHCDATLPAGGPKGGRPWTVCRSATCQRRDLMRRRALMTARRWLKWAERQGKPEAEARWRARIAALA